MCLALVAVAGAVCMIVGLVLGITLEYRHWDRKVVESLESADMDTQETGGA